jgi:NAD(P)-dependent dehydrogenase (short-subunit alcohol dehydrogenase family)
MTLAGAKRGKVALVTGAARGLGLAFAHRLATEGAIVIAVDREPAPSVADDLKMAGATDSAFFQIDISDEENVEQLACDMVARFGRCDIVVNNAGMVPRGMIQETTLADWRRVMAINVESMFLICRAFLPAMIAQRYGRIVNITSDALGGAISGFSNYMASKGAVVGLTRGLANDVGVHGITVNCIAPGLTRTLRTEAEVSDPRVFDKIAQAQAIKRAAVPEDLVGALSFLTSDDAAFMTGQTLIVNGGLLKAL